MPTGLRWGLRQIAWGLAAFAVASTGLAAQGGGGQGPGGSGPGSVRRVYHVYYMPFFEARMLAEAQCGAAANCPGEFYPGEGIFEITASEEAHARIAAMLKEKDVPPPTHDFQIVLLVGGSEAAASDTLPEEARKALDDTKRFLPFRSYRLLGSGLVRTAGESAIGLGGNEGYEARFRFRSDPASDKPLMIQNFELVRHYVLDHPGGTATSDKETVLATSFAIEPGQTVVLGTSKLAGGDKALVVLLTAVK